VCSPKRVESFRLGLRQLLFALALSGGTVVAAEQDDWSFDVNPYLWVASVGVETSLPHLPSTPASGVDRYETSISAGAMIAAQARYRSVGIFADFAWLRLDTEATDPGRAYSAVNLRSDFIHSTAALTYRLPLREKLKIDLLAGARVWHVETDLNFESGALPGFHRNGDRTWADPIVGADVSYDLTARWSIGAKGTIGGFGVSADIAAEVFVGATYRFTDWCSATAGYRYLYEDYSQDNYRLKLDAQGLLLGLGFHF
jgi:hypothetical protein